MRGYGCCGRAVRRNCWLNRADALVRVVDDSLRRLLVLDDRRLVVERAWIEFLYGHDYASSSTS